MTAVLHRERREQDEVVCSCGRRWDVGDDHPLDTDEAIMDQLELPMPISGLPLDLRTLSLDVHRANIAAGWWLVEEGTNRTRHRNVGELLALVHSEISEADEGFSGDLPDDKLPHRRMAEVELADTAIRALDILGFYDNVDAWFAASERKANVPVGYLNEDDYGAWLRGMHKATTRALEGFRKSNIARGCTELVHLLAIIHFCAIHFRFDLTGAIAEKRAFNARRADHKPENRAQVGGKRF